LKGGACGTIENSDARSASEFGNTSCPVLYDSRHKEVFKERGSGVNAFRYSEIADILLDSYGEKCYNNTKEGA